MPTHAPRGGIDALSREIFERGVRYCLPSALLTRTGQTDRSSATLALSNRDDGSVDLTWLGATFHVCHPARPLTESEIKLLRSIGRVLSSRHRVLVDAAVAADRLDLFRGLPEDRYVSAFLDSSPYTHGEPGFDRIAEAIEVLRISSSSTYENRRINTGVLLFGSMPDPCHEEPTLPEGALPYSTALTTSRTFSRLSDGMRTVALVDAAGRLVELVDIGEWAKPYDDLDLPVPCAERFVEHCRATLCGGHVCLVLTRNGEIKAFADGVQVFNFLDGRWRLSDIAEKYAQFESALGHATLADRLFRAALNLAERRRGGLFVMLASPADADHLVAMDDRLDGGATATAEHRSKTQFHYLLRGKSVLDLTSTVLESIARIDGAIVLDRAANLLAFGAILRDRLVAPEADRHAVEGGRTTAAIVASRYGHALKVSEDGLVSFYSGGRAIWEI